MSKENVEIVRRALEAAFRKPKPEFATVNALFDSDHELISLTTRVEGRSFHGARGFREWLSDMDEAWASWEGRIARIVDVDDERVLAVMGISGISKRAGVPFDQNRPFLVTVRNGKIVRSESYESESIALPRAVGVEGGCLPKLMAMKFHVTTFGCQMNEHDSERMRGMLQSLGYEEAPSRDGADLILFNTCSIRESADNRFVAHLGEAKRLKGEDPSRVVGVGGCWAQSVKEEVFERFPFVDVAFGPGQIHRLAEFLTADSLTAQGYFEFEDFSGHLPAKREREFQAWLQISQGCNCACSYCIVPSTRGREQSRPPAELVDEVERLGADGVREVTLLGQNVNSYGRDLPKEQKTTFAELLARLDEIDGIERIRYTSPHPKDMREDVIRAHAELPSLCEHIHLPLQSGSSRILKAMRRTYDRERYLDRVAQIREHVPDCSLTTDIIVGFPGETEEDFAQTLELVDEVGYDSAFTFIFSPRRGTEAASLGEQIPHPVKRERMGRLVELVQDHARRRSQRFVGRTMEVLVEGTSRTDASRLRGRTRHNKTVNFDGTATPGELVSVEIDTATSTTLSGTEKIASRVA